ncbi:MAG: hypothetical protein H9W81_12600 [Enterococcus sp.]|nr:hypothetical protein [Enterococcus sp.]
MEVLSSLYSPATTAIAGFISAAIFSLIIPRILDTFTDKDSRELKTILDIKTSWDKAAIEYDPEIDDLMRIYETRYTLSLFKRFRSRHFHPAMSLWATTAVIFTYTLLAMVFAALLISAFLLYPQIVAMSVGIFLVILLIGYAVVRLSMIRKTQSPFFYTARMHHPNKGDKVIKVTTVQDDETSNLIYDFIGLPTHSSWFRKAENRLSIYELRNENNGYAEYTYARTRTMTLLEQEWYLRLNSLRSFIKKASYIPFTLKTKAHAHHTPYYMTMDGAEAIRNIVWT